MPDQVRYGSLLMVNDASEVTEATSVVIIDDQPLILYVREVTDATGKTDDNTPLAGMMVALFAAITCMSGAIIYKKRRRY